MVTDPLSGISFVFSPNMLITVLLSLNFGFMSSPAEINIQIVESNVCQQLSSLVISDTLDLINTCHRASTFFTEDSFERQSYTERKREKHRTFHLLSQYPRGHGSWSRTRQKPRARNYSSLAHGCRDLCTRAIFSAAVPHALQGKQM